ncbi:TPA: hypothetical protein ACH3X1_001665 [Trebouxia sp. C0004]
MGPGDNVPFVSIAPKVVAPVAQKDQQWVLECIELLQWKRGADDTTHTFSSADAELQLMLSACIREQYDFQLSARSGVSSDLCDMILATAAKGQSFQGIQGTIEEMHRKQSYRAELAYVTSLPLIDSAFKKAEQDSNVPSTSKAAPDSFGSFELLVQIMGQYAVRSKSLAEINMPLTRMHSRLVKLQGTAPPTPPPLSHPAIC